MAEKGETSAMRAGSDLTLDFDRGVEVRVDLRRVNMTREQAGILDKLVRGLGDVAVQSCEGDRCPAQDVLEPDEFEKIRHLRATLGGTTGGVAAGPIVDFCLNVINVHEG
jgi:hypothetical protein